MHVLDLCHGCICRLCGGHTEYDTLKHSWALLHLAFSPINQICSNCSRTSISPLLLKTLGTSFLPSSGWLPACLHSLHPLSSLLMKMNMAIWRLLTLGSLLLFLRSVSERIWVVREWEWWRKVFNSSMRFVPGIISICTPPLPSPHILEIWSHCP